MEENFGGKEHWKQKFYKNNIEKYLKFQREKLGISNEHKKASETY